MIRLGLSLAAVLAAALVAAAAGPVPPRTVAAARVSPPEHTLVRLVNHVRTRNGLRSLRVSRALSIAAEQHTRDMLGRDFFAHPSSDGTAFAHRVRRYTRASVVGETLAVTGRRRGGAGTIVQMWMRSPPHRAVLLGSGFHRIGIARRWGALGGGRRSVVTADFASRR